MWARREAPLPKRIEKPRSGVEIRLLNRKAGEIGARREAPLPKRIEKPRSGVEIRLLNRKTGEIGQGAKHVYIFGKSAV